MTSDLRRYMTLVETFDKPASYDWTIRNAINWFANFAIGKKRLYEMIARRVSMGSYELKIIANPNVADTTLFILSAP